MAITKDSVIAKLLEGWGINLEDVNAQLDRIAAKFPDAEQRIAELKEWLATRIPNTAGLVGMLTGIATDIWTQTSGADPEAWRGSV